MERFIDTILGTIKAVEDRLRAELHELRAMPPVHGKDGRDGIDGKDGTNGLNGKDGADGLNGKDGRDGLPGVPGLQGEKGLDGKDGKDGRDGIDGINGKDGSGFDNLEFESDEHGRLYIKFVRGDEVKRARIPGFHDRGVWKQGEEYVKGDAVTWGGSLWIAQTDTTAKPEQAGVESRAWRLSVKRGAEGKQGQKGETGERGAIGPQGPQGRPGF